MSTFEQRFGLDREWIEKQAQMYENEEQSINEDAVVYAGAHVDAVGSKRVTVIYKAKDTLKVDQLAKARGCKSSDIYRQALAQYLQNM